MFHQNAFSTINDENSKLRTFGMIKCSIGLEKYLKKVKKNLKHRISLSRLRLSSHRLMIETGRHKKIAASERFCSFCQTQIEDEIHFVIKCQIYDALRKPLVEACTALGSITTLIEKNSSSSLLLKICKAFLPNLFFWLRNIDLFYYKTLKVQINCSLLSIRLIMILYNIWSDSGIPLKTLYTQYKLFTPIA